MAQSPAATDLSGGKASEALSTVRRNNLAAEDAVYFQSNSSLDAVVSTWTGSGTTGLPAPSVRGGDRKDVVHVLLVSLPREMEGMSVPVSPTSNWRGELARPALFPSASILSRPDPLPVCTYGRGWRCCWLISPPAISSLPPWPSPVPTTDCKTDRESSGRRSSFPTPNSPPTTTPGSDCRDEAEWLNPSPPTLTRLLSVPSPILDNFSFTFFRNPEKDCRRLMSSEVRDCAG